MTPIVPGLRGTHPALLDAARVPIPGLSMLSGDGDLGTVLLWTADVRGMFGAKPS